MKRPKPDFLEAQKGASLIVNEEQETYPRLVGGQTYNLSVKSGITCSTSDDLKLTYTQVKVDGYDLPNWVSFNDQTGKLELTTPSLSYDQIYEFAIETKVNGQPDVYTKSFKLEVSAQNDPNVPPSTPNNLDRLFLGEHEPHRTLQTDCYDSRCYY